MYMYTKDEAAFKVIATENEEVKADYIFDQLKDAIIFENQMSKKGYTTQVERVLL
jgi:hypothetical protein